MSKASPRENQRHATAVAVRSAPSTLRGIALLLDLVPLLLRR